MTQVLVIGAYGLIGSAVARRLSADDCAVIGLGRNAETAQRVMSGIDWIIRDLVDLRDEAAWLPLLDGMSFVVNCAGALQDGGNDSLDAVHRDTVIAMVRACEATGTGIVQISATGAAETASTPFMRTKAAGDAAVREAKTQTWIFRPGLVLAPTAYGGTTLLRMLAAVPVIQPLALPDTRIQTVGVGEVAGAVSRAVSGDIPPGTECDLIENSAHPLREVIAAQRRWLGFGTARRDMTLPDFAIGIVRRVADVFGRLGWRSPLRSSTVRMLEEGVTGDPAPWRAISGSGLLSMTETLGAVSATVEDRLFARIALLMPLVIAILFVFWLISGIVGLLRVDEAARMLDGWPRGLALGSVVFWSLVDIAIAAALLIRKTATKACWAMVIVSIVYLLSATLITPHLWADPLGPLVKVLPAIALALVARAMLETR